MGILVQPRAPVASPALAPLRLGEGGGGRGGRVRGVAKHRPAPGEGCLLLGVLACVDTLSATLPRKRGRERTFSAAGFEVEL